jgi:Tol biopolymer transport system component
MKFKKPLLIIPFLLIVIILGVILLKKHAAYPSEKVLPHTTISITKSDTLRIDSYVTKVLDASIKEANSTNNNFTDICPITYKVNQYHEISLPNEKIHSLRISPDGNRIALCKSTYGVKSISILDIQTNNHLHLGLSLDYCYDPSWNNDGAKIVFAGMKNGKSDIYMFDLKEKKLINVTNDSASVSRVKSWPQFSPHKFDLFYRIAYVSEQDKRKDIWWVRESGEYDMPITLPVEKVASYDKHPYWNEIGPGECPKFITLGGEYPEWSPSGNLLTYHTSKGNKVLQYNYYEWWKISKIPLPQTEGQISWSPNQTKILNVYNGIVKLISRNNFKQTSTLFPNKTVSSIAYHPSGQAFAYVYNKNNEDVIAIEPFYDSLGDVANLWMYPYNEAQLANLTTNQMLLLNSKNDQIYKLYDSERYSCGEDIAVGFHARPYLVTSDAVLETYYAAYSALYDYVEHVTLSNTLKDMCLQALDVAHSLKASEDIQTLFATGLCLLQPTNISSASIKTKEEVNRIISAKGSEKSLFGKSLNYTNFFIRGKYERDTIMQGYFRAIKWFQEFTFELSDRDDYKNIQELLPILNNPKVKVSFEKIYSCYRETVGESRYFDATNLTNQSISNSAPKIKSKLPWVKQVPRFRIMPPVYTLDAYMFDNLITHDGSGVGSLINTRVFPKGMDIFACLGSKEARDILVNEFKESRYENYEKVLDSITDLIKDYPDTTWSANLYQNWLGALQALVKEPTSESPDFCKTKAWKRKQLNSALGSWVNLRYETIAIVEQVAAECGEGGYEILNAGHPRGYVEPNPEFFHKLDEGFAKIESSLNEKISDEDLKQGVVPRISEYRKQIKNLEVIAQKELRGEQLTDDEYNQILEIGGVIEHFILLMKSLNGGESDHAIRNPDPINKIVDVQHDNVSGTRLYEALGYADEVNAVVPFFGKRQIVKGPVYSYYELVSNDELSSDKWIKMKEPHPIWIRYLYEGNSTTTLADLSDFK